MLRKCWLCNNHELTSVNVNLSRNFLVHVYPYNFLSISVSEVLLQR